MSGPWSAREHVVVVFVVSFLLALVSAASIANAKGSAGGTGSRAAAAPTSAANAANQASGQPSTSRSTPAATTTTSSDKGSCPVGTVIVQTIPVAPLIDQITGAQHDMKCNPVDLTVRTVGNGVSAAGNAVVNGAMSDVAKFFVDGATTIGGWDADAMKATTTPVLSSGWFCNGAASDCGTDSVYGYMFLVGGLLAGVAALIGIVCAVLKRSPDDLGNVLYGVFRAGLVGGLVVPLTGAALSIADGISRDVMSQMPTTFVSTLESGWGASGLGGFASSAVALLLAIVEIAVGLVVWVELLFRGAAILLAVGFVAITLATAVWPHLLSVHHRLLHILGVFIVMKPVVLLSMLIGGALVAGGFSLTKGIAQDVQALVEGVIILCMAAVSPWVLLRVTGLDVGVMGERRSSRRSQEGSSSSSQEGRGYILGGELAPDEGPAPAAGGRSSAGDGGSGGGSRGSGSRRGSGVRSGGGLGVGGPAASDAAGGGGGGSGGGSGGARGVRPWVPSPMAFAAGAMGMVQSVGQSGAARVHAGTGATGIPPSRNPLAAYRAESGLGLGEDGGPSRPSGTPRPADGPGGGAAAGGDGSPAGGGGGGSGGGSGGGDSPAGGPVDRAADVPTPPAGGSSGSPGLDAGGASGSSGSGSERKE